MLDREFGGNGKGKGRAKDSAFADDEGKPLVGTVDEKGKLVTQGPKKRAVVRFLQIVLALGAAVPSIYVALVCLLSSSIPPYSMSCR
jgi:hypothetical protein